MARSRQHLQSQGISHRLQFRTLIFSLISISTLLRLYGARTKRSPGTNTIWAVLHTVHTLYNFSQMLKENAAIIEQKTRPFVDAGIWVLCPFTDWCARLVITTKSRICHDFMDLNRVMAHDAYPIVSMQVILSRFSGKGMFSIWDADRGFNQIMNTLRAALRAAFEYKDGH